MSEVERTLWCGNLSPKVDEELLFELFLQAGPLEKVVIPKEKNGCNKGYGFVIFKHEVSVLYAIELLKGISLFGMRILPQHTLTSLSAKNLSHHRRASLQDHRLHPHPNMAANTAFHGFNIPVVATRVQQPYCGDLQTPVSGMHMQEPYFGYPQIPVGNIMQQPYWENPKFQNIMAAPMPHDHMMSHMQNHKRSRTHHGGPLNYGYYCPDHRGNFFPKFSAAVHSPNISLTDFGDSRQNQRHEDHVKPRGRDNLMSLDRGQRRSFHTLYDRRRGARK